ncbi:MAG: type I-B CRISPR-associated protein Cas5b [Candidatus Cloacimonadaceae bacterium]|jgi:CRISPR-associated protein Cas5h
MTPTKILCFELFGDYAQFRKFFTNMSPLSFSIPPRTVLMGIIGAMLGVDKAENPEHFTPQDSFLALRLMNPVKRTRIAHNYLKVTSARHLYDYDQHKPTNVEFLKDVRYRLYFSCQDQEKYQRLKSKLEQHHSHYTISLGISGCLANYEYLGEFELETMEPHADTLLHSVIPTDSIEELIIDEPLNLQKVVMPTFMNNDREVQSYDEVLFEQNGKPISIKIKDAYYKVKTLNDVIHGI